MRATGWPWDHDRYRCMNKLNNVHGRVRSGVTMESWQISVCMHKLSNVHGCVHSGTAMASWQLSVYICIKQCNGHVHSAAIIESWQIYVCMHKLNSWCCCVRSRATMESWQISVCIYKLNNAHWRVHGRVAMESSHIPACTYKFNNVQDMWLTWQPLNDVFMCMFQLNTTQIHVRHTAAAPNGPDTVSPPPNTRAHYLLWCVMVLPPGRTRRKLFSHNAECFSEMAPPWRYTNQTMIMLCCVGGFYFMRFLFVCTIVD